MKISGSKYKRGVYGKRSQKIKARFYVKKLKEKYSMRLLNICAAAVLVLISFSMINLFKDKDYNSVEDVLSLRVPFAAVSALMELSEKYGLEFAQLLTLFSLENNFFSENPREKQNIETDVKTIEKKYIMNYNKLIDSYPKDIFDKYYSLYKGVIEDIVYFPIPYGYGDYMYGDSFKTPFRETYLSRFGCDIFDRENIRGRLPVVSMTNGTIKKIGYSDKEGYNVTVITGSGSEYYYSRLDSVSGNLADGGALLAGELLGYMGEAESASAVSLYVAISPSHKISKEKVWINPYIFLRISELQNNHIITE